MLQRHDNEPINDPDPVDVVDGYKRLLIRIVTIAAADLACIETTGRRFSDGKHRTFCDRLGHKNGKDELESFFFSGWFEYICDALDLEPERALSNLNLTDDETSKALLDLREKSVNIERIMAKQLLYSWLEEEQGTADNPSMPHTPDL